MPLVTILSDIHANLPALTAVINEAQQCGATQIVVLGDIIGYGGSPAECVTMIQNLEASCVIGNHDAEIRDFRKRGYTFPESNWRASDYLAGLAHAARCLDPAQAKWLAALPYRITIPGAIAAHASLDEPEAFKPIDDLASARPTLEILREQKSQVGFFGHTHQQAIFAEDKSTLEWLDGDRFRIPVGVACAVTVGAVGRPPPDANGRATWVLWNPEKGVVEFRKTCYDREQAWVDIAQAGLPITASLALLTTEEIDQLLG